MFKKGLLLLIVLSCSVAHAERVNVKYMKVCVDGKIVYTQCKHNKKNECVVNESASIRTNRPCKG